VRNKRTCTSRLIEGGGKIGSDHLRASTDFERYFGGKRLHTPLEKRGGKKGNKGKTPSSGVVSRGPAFTLTDT